MEQEKWGTVEYYKQMFDDIIVDAAVSTEIEDNLKISMNILQAFEQSVLEWMKYHETASKSYNELLHRYMYGKTLDAR